jgi:hypothetical protein
MVISFAKLSGTHIKKYTLRMNVSSRTLYLQNLHNFYFYITNKIAVGYIFLSN